MQSTHVLAPPQTTEGRWARTAPGGAECPPHVLIDGIPVFDGDLDDAVSWCRARQETGVGIRVATANLDFFALAHKQVALRSDLRNSSIVVADGAPVAWLARLAGARRVRRVPGVDLARALCCSRTGRTMRVALYGSRPEVCREAADFIERETGGVVVAALSPPFRELTDGEREGYLRALSESGADLVLVALGCPAQERFIAESFTALPGAIWVGVGGTLDFFAGRKRRAPGMAQSFGAEWLVRFLQEPRRLGPRYFGRDLPALSRLVPVTLTGRLRRSGAPTPVVAR